MKAKTRVSRVAALALFVVTVAGCSERESGNPARSGAQSANSGSTKSADTQRLGDVEAAISSSGSPNYSGACEGISATAGVHYLSLGHDGWERTYVMTVPDSASGDSPAHPLLIAMHGYGGSGAGMRSMIQQSSGFEDSYVVLYPDGAGDDNGPRGWNSGHPKCCGPALDNNVDDVGFLRDLVNTAAQDACVDLNRVYATGFSNGGDMAQRLACDASDLVAAVTSVAGRFDYHSNACPGDWPVPAVLYRGQLDRTVPYEGDILSLVALKTIPAIEGFERIARNHRCLASPVSAKLTEDTSCRRFDDCVAGFELTLCTTADAGHCWPGIGNCSQGGSQVFSASDHMQEFFAKH